MTDKPEPGLWQTAGRILILAGVAVWAVYGVCLLAGSETTVGWFLPLHLAGVIPGVILSRWGTIRRWLGWGSAT